MIRGKNDFSVHKFNYKLQIHLSTSIIEVLSPKTPAILRTIQVFCKAQCYITYCPQSAVRRYHGHSSVSKQSQKTTGTCPQIFIGSQINKCLEKISKKLSKWTGFANLNTSHAWLCDPASTAFRQVEVSVHSAFRSIFMNSYTK